MKRKKKIQAMGNEYRELQARIFGRTVVMLAVSVAVTLWVCEFVLRGNFGDFAVNFLERFIYHDYDRAYQVYQRVFRNYMEIHIIIAALVLFLIILRIYLKGFTKYFNEINRGIDALLTEDTQEVVLPPGLAATEKKINSIKRTLEQRKTATELAEQRKNDLVVYLAHDLKTPLTSVIGYLTLLRDEGEISPKLREKYLSVSLEKAERLEELINEFFDITRFNLSNITLEYSRVNLTRLLEQLIYEFGPMFLEKNLQCVLDIAPDTELRCDVNKMQRVFDNLLRNAVNYSFENGTVTIRVTQSKTKLHMKVINQGNTIPEDKLERTFEQFYRLDTSRSSKSGGAGLGLAIAREIVELHGGAILARSENEVTQFEVILPVS